MNQPVCCPKDVDCLYRQIFEDVRRDVKGEDLYIRQLITCIFSAFGPSPLNYYILGPGGVGKTYPIVQVVRRFQARYAQWPIKKFKRASEKNFYYSGKYDEKTQTYRQNFKHKVLVFLEKVEPGLFKEFLSVMSHDDVRLISEIVGKTKSGKNISMRYVWDNWPAFIFALADIHEMDEQMSRRFTFVTPQDTARKTRAGLDYHSLRVGGGILFESEEDAQIISIRERVHDLIDYLRNKEFKVIVPEVIAPAFPGKAPQEMSTFGKIVSHTMAVSLMHAKDRYQLKINDKRYLIAATGDVNEAWALVSDLSPIPPALQWIASIARSLSEEYDSFTAKDVRTTLLKANIDRSIVTIRNYLRALAGTGYLEEIIDPTDRRQRRYQLSEDAGTFEKARLINKLDPMPKLRDVFINTIQKLISENETRYNLKVKFYLGDKQLYSGPLGKLKKFIQKEDINFLKKQR